MESDAAAAHHPPGLDLALDDLIRSHRAERPQAAQRRSGPSHHGRGGGGRGRRDSTTSSGGGFPVHGVQRGGVSKPSRQQGQQQQQHRRSSDLLSRLGPPLGRPAPRGAAAVPFVDGLTGYKKYECVKPTGDGGAALYFHETAVCTAKPDGSVVLDSGGHVHSKATQKSIAGALALFGLTLKALRDPKNGDMTWHVSDGKAFLRRFTDGMVLPPPPPTHAGGQQTRAQMLMRNYSATPRASRPAGDGQRQQQLRSEMQE